jgi:eukaryotic-like serine/threonine-protein kinase
MAGGKYRQAMGLPDTTVQLGRYRLVERLGAGGMAVVYKAIVEGPKGFSRPFVIKRILPTFSRDESFVNMLLTEARLSAMLRHPGIVQVVELGEADGEFFLAMEYVEGHDLQTIMKRASQQKRAFSPAAAVYVLSVLLDALGYAHSLLDEEGRALEIVHRDVSPSNVMVTHDGAIKLLDFGIAKAASHVREERTRTGTLKGKLSYLSPEQAEGLKVDKRADIFALGIVFHELLTMKRLFRGEDDFQTLRLVREARVEPPSVLSPDVSPELDRVVLGMLTRDPNERFQTCEEALEALRPVLHQLRADSGALKRWLAELGPIERRAQPVDAADLPAGAATKTISSPSAVIAATLTRSSGEILPIADPSGSLLQPKRTAMWVGGALGMVAAVVIAIVLATGTPKQVPIDPVAPIVTAPPPAPIAVAPPPPPKPEPKVEPKVTPKVELPSPPKPEPPAPKVEPVHLVVLGTEGAEVIADSKSLGRVPLDKELPRIEGTRRLMVRLSGHQPMLQEIAGSKNVTLTARLRKNPPPAPTPRPAPPPVAVTKPKPKSQKAEIKDPFER